MFDGLGLGAGRLGSMARERDRDRKVFDVGAGSNEIEEGGGDRVCTVECSVLGVHI